MLQDLYTVEENHNITHDTYEMVLSGNTEQIRNPGQFVNILIPGFTLRRPFSVTTWENSHFRITYKVVGGGTEVLSGLEKGEQLDILTGLGNGFDVESAGDCPLLIAGGSGISPIYGLAEILKRRGITPIVLMGFASIRDVTYDDDMRALGCHVLVATEDGTCGIHGLVTDAMAGIQTYSYVYCCGPEEMMKTVYKTAKTDGQFSFEARMGCGFGACMGCSMMTKSGTKRICKDGPVFRKEDLLW